MYYVRLSEHSISFFPLSMPQQTSGHQRRVPCERTLSSRTSPSTPCEFIYRLVWLMCALPLFGAYARIELSSWASDNLHVELQGRTVVACPRCKTMCRMQPLYTLTNGKRFRVKDSPALSTAPKSTPASPHAYQSAARPHSPPAFAGYRPSLPSFASATQSSSPRLYSCGAQPWAESYSNCFLLPLLA